MCRCSNEYEYCEKCIDRCVPKRQYETSGTMWVSQTMIDGKAIDNGITITSGDSGDLIFNSGGGGTANYPDPSIRINGLPVYVEAVCGYAAAGKTKTWVHMWACTACSPKCEERKRENEFYTRMQLQGNEPIKETISTAIAPEDTRSPKEKDSFHKVPVHLFPTTAIIAGAITLAQGHRKPGRRIYNWREEPIKATDYTSAAQRHLARWLDGEDSDEELSELAGQPISHLWAALSSLAIMIDAQECGSFKDDRPPKGVAAEMLRRLTPALKPNT